MPIYEFRCKKCKKTTEKMIYKDEEDNYIICKCGYIANKILSSGIFKIKGYSSSNNYSKKDK